MNLNEAVSLCTRYDEVLLECMSNYHNMVTERLTYAAPKRITCLEHAYSHIQQRRQQIRRVLEKTYRVINPTADYFELNLYVLSFEFKGITL